MKEEPKHLTAEQYFWSNETPDYYHDEDEPSKPVIMMMESYAEKRVREAKIEMLQRLVDFGWNETFDEMYFTMEEELSKLKGE